MKMHDRKSLLFEPQSALFDIRKPDRHSACTYFMWQTSHGCNHQGAPKPDQAAEPRITCRARQVMSPTLNSCPFASCLPYSYALERHDYAFNYFPSSCLPAPFIQRSQPRPDSSFNLLLRDIQQLPLLPFSLLSTRNHSPVCMPIQIELRDLIGVADLHLHPSFRYAISLLHLVAVVLLSIVGTLHRESFA